MVFKSIKPLNARKSLAYHAHIYKSYAYSFYQYVHAVRSFLDRSIEPYSKCHNDSVWHYSIIDFITPLKFPDRTKNVLHFSPL